MKVIKGNCLQCKQQEILVLEPISKYEIAYCWTCIQCEFFRVKVEEWKKEMRIKENE